MTPVRLEPAALRSRVKHSTTEPLRSLSHVAYQIKADDANSNIVANILPTDTPSTQRIGSKGQTISFSESSHVVYQIKGN